MAILVVVLDDVGRIEDVPEDGGNREEVAEAEGVPLKRLEEEVRTRDDDEDRGMPGLANNKRN
jgi:hypothetical protein